MVAEMEIMVPYPLHQIAEMVTQDILRLAVAVVAVGITTQEMVEAV
jgi:hypothetical protein